MKLVLLVSVVGLALAAKLPDQNEDRADLRVLNHWQISGLVPDLIDAEPIRTLRVIYEDGQRLKLGRRSTPNRTKNPPQIIKWNCDKTKHYALLFVDPDAPNRANATMRSVLHWAVVNVPGCDLDRGEIIAPYIGAGPAKNSGWHRFTFLVYKQFDQHTFSEIPFLSRFEGFDVRQFASDNFLTLDSGNFFFAKYDDTVPVLEQQIQSMAMEAEQSGK